MLEHRPPGVDDRRDLVGCDARIRELDRRFDHRQRERLHAVPEQPEVAHLGGEQPLVEVVLPDIWLHQFAEPLLRHREDRLVVPQRVVAVERDQLDHGAQDTTNADASRSEVWAAGIEGTPPAMLDRVLTVRLLFGLGVAIAVLLAFSMGVALITVAFGTASDVRAGVRPGSVGSAMLRALIPSLVVGALAAVVCKPETGRRR